MFIQMDFPSQSLGYPTKVDIVLPNGRAEQKYPVLYLLHGGDGAPWVRHTAVERYAEEAGLAVVMPYSRNTCWRKAVISYPGMQLEPEKVEDFEGFLMQELPELIGSVFPISRRAEDTYIVGLSLGGYGAAYYGSMYPERFCEVGVFSGYVLNYKMFQADRSRLSREELRENLIPDLREPVEAAGKAGRKLPIFFLMNGTKDVREFMPAYAELLEENGAEVVADFDTYEYGHEWAMWEVSIREFIRDIVNRRKK